MRYYKNGLEDSVWSIINAQGDTLRRDYFSNGVWKKVEYIYKTSYGFEIVSIDNLYDFSNRIEIDEIKECYPSRVKIHETNFYRNRYLKSIDYFKNGFNINSTLYFINDSILFEKNKLNTKDSSYSKSIINGILNKEEIIYTNGSAHYKYYTPIDQISRYDVVAPKNNLTTTEEFFKPEYLRIEYNQDRNKKYLFHRTYYNKQGAILNQDTANINDRGLINTTYYLDTIDTQKRVLDSYWSPGYYRYTYKNIKGETIYTKTNTDDDYPKTFFDRTIEEEFFQPEYVKIKYYKDKQNTNIIHRYYYNKSEKIIKQDTINPNDYNNLQYRNITLPTEHNK